MNPVDLKSGLLKDFGNLYKKIESDSYSNEGNDDYNVIIKVGQENFKAHSVILKARSEYLRNLINDYKRKSILLPNIYNIKIGKITLEISDISSNVFKVCLKYIYTGEFSLQGCDEEFIFCLIIAADKLSLIDMVDYLQNYFIEQKSSWIEKNIIDIYQTTLNHLELQIHCEKLIKQEPMLIFNSENFHKLEKEIFLDLIQRDDLPLQEVEIWRYLVKWGLEQKPPIINKNIEQWNSSEMFEFTKRLKDFIPYIRFFTIPSSIYHSDIRPYKEIIPPKRIEQLEKFYLVGPPLPPGALPPRRTLKKSNSKPNLKRKPTFPQQRRKENGLQDQQSPPTPPPRPGRRKENGLRDQQSPPTPPPRPGRRKENGLQDQQSPPTSPKDLIRPKVPKENESKNQQSPPISPEKGNESQDQQSSPTSPKVRFKMEKNESQNQQSPPTSPISPKVLFQSKIQKVNESQNQQSPTSPTSPKVLPQPQIQKEKDFKNGLTRSISDFKDFKFDSVLINKMQIRRISHWIDGFDDFDENNRNSSPKSNFFLLTRGDRDGITHEIFHSLCDNKGPTLVLAKVEETNDIIGGYNPVSWASSNEWIETNESFIFSFKSDGNKEGIDDIILSRIKNPIAAIWDGDSSYDVAFSSDLQLFNGDYEQKHYEKKIMTENRFRIVNYEVFQVKENLKNLE